VHETAEVGPREPAQRPCTRDRDVVQSPFSVIGPHAPDRWQTHGCFRRTETHRCTFNGTLGAPAHILGQLVNDGGQRVLVLGPQLHRYLRKAVPKCGLPVGAVDGHAHNPVLHLRLHLGPQRLQQPLQRAQNDAQLPHIKAIGGKWNNSEYLPSKLTPESRLLVICGMKQSTCSYLHAAKPSCASSRR
jgi:hypothetical protein